jgi:hypothetical protein
MVIPAKGFDFHHDAKQQKEKQKTPFLTKNKDISPTS